MFKFACARYAARRGPPFRPCVRASVRPFVGHKGRRQEENTLFIGGGPFVKMVAPDFLRGRLHYL